MNLAPDSGSYQAPVLSLWIFRAETDIRFRFVTYRFIKTAICLPYLFRIALQCIKRSEDFSTVNQIHRRMLQVEFRMPGLALHQNLEIRKREINLYQAAIGYGLSHNDLLFMK